MLARLGTLDNLDPHIIVIQQMAINHGSMRVIISTFSGGGGSVEDGVGTIYIGHCARCFYTWTDRS